MVLHLCIAQHKRGHTKIQSLLASLFLIKGKLPGEAEGTNKVCRGRSITHPAVAASSPLSIAHSTQGGSRHAAAICAVPLLSLIHI